MEDVRTTERRILGPYTGRRISGASPQLFDAVATIEYRFANDTLRVVGVPVQWDEANERQYMRGKDGLRLHALVEAFMDAQHRRVDHSVPLRVTLQAANVFADAA